MNKFIILYFLQLRAHHSQSFHLPPYSFCKALASSTTDLRNVLLGKPLRLSCRFHYRDWCAISSAGLLSVWSIQFNFRRLIISFIQLYVSARSQTFVHEKLKTKCARLCALLTNGSTDIGLSYSRCCSAYHTPGVLSELCFSRL